MAGPDLGAFGQSALASVQRMTGPQRVTLALAFVATLLGVFLVANATSNTPMSPLFTDLEPETAAAVTAALDGRGIEFELMGGGRIVQVPADQVHQLRLDLSALDLPSGSDGWSLLDNQSITATSADRDIAYQRAMQGELAKTISVIEGVASANVHLVIPERDILIDDGKQASASVLLVTGGSNVSPTQVDAIVNLVASSVEGLSTDQISVTNEEGRVLASPGDGRGIVGLQGEVQFRASRQFEMALENQLEELLTTIVGLGGAQVAVSADLDFDSVLTTSETHTPIQSESGSQMLDRQTTRFEIYRGDEVAAEEGEVAVELPDDALQGNGEANFDDGVQYGLDEKDSIFAVDKVITNAESAPGAIRSLSVAVLLDETAIDAARLPEIEAAIEAAAGIKVERGDTLAVSLMPLNEDIKAAIAAQSQVVDELAASSGGGMDLVGLIRTIGTVILAIVALFFGLKYTGKGPKRRVIDSIDMAELEANRAAGALGAGGQSGNAVQSIPVEELVATEEQLESLIANQTDDVAGVLKTWLNDAEGATR